LSLEPVEWEVLAKVDGEATLKRIARSLGRAELEVARAMYGLAEAGIVEIRPRSAGSNGAVAWEAEVRGIEEALQAGWLDEADRRAVGLLTKRPAAAAIHALRGRILGDQGDYEGAIHAFNRAIELDPLLSSAYFHLARVAFRHGELARGRRALNTYGRLSDTSSERRANAARMSTGLEQLMVALEEAVE
jgi:tetratricopeptide (TPR) repeat protein